MKIKSVTIENFHNVKYKTYDFEDLNYIHGLNGAGKSTILEAIQLGVLGYIPNYPKRLDNMLKHASGTPVQIKVTFDDGSYTERIYTIKNNKVSCESRGDILQANQLEIPVYNFNQFLSMSANEQKKWFISILPNTDDELDWENIFTNTTAKLPIFDYNYIHTMASNADAYDTVAEVHEMIKSNISATKAAIKEKQDTLSNLMYYENIDSYDEPTINRKIESLNKNLSIYTQMCSVINIINVMKDELNNLPRPEYNNFACDPRQIAISLKLEEVEQNIHDLQSKKIVLEKNIVPIQKEYEDAKKKLDSCISPDKIQDICPYISSIKCASLIEYKSELEENYNFAFNNYNVKQNLLDKATTELNKCIEQIQDCEDIKQELENSKNELKLSYTQYEQVQDKLNNYLNSLDFDIDDNESLESIQAKIKDITDQINTYTKIKEQIIANKSYNAISNQVREELNTAEQHMEMLKVWQTYTDQNNLQATLVARPFKILASNITIMLRKMFCTSDVNCWFNLDTKSNSFDFGIIYDEDINPISFTTLSSGEKCMYMIALQSALICSVNTTTNLNVIMIDDAFDHLDKNNIESLIEAMQSESDIQYIIAGVVDIPNANAYTKLNQISV